MTSFHNRTSAIDDDDIDLPDNLSRGMAQALIHRMDPRQPLTDLGRPYRSQSLAEMAREHLNARGINVRGMSRMELASAALQRRDSPGSLGTSDFASLLSAVATKRLRQAYSENAGSFRQWARQAPDIPDFKPISVVAFSGMPDLLQVREHGEFTLGKVADAGETYQLLTYGRIVALTRQALVNDDLRAFDRMAQAFGASAARLENRLVYAQLTSNPNLADGNPLFAIGRGNLATGVGSALSAAALGSARAAMRVQTGLQGETLNIPPAYLIAPAALEQTAYQLTSSQYLPAKATDINEFRQGGRSALQPVIEPILDSVSATAWYAAASSGAVDTVEYAYLQGADGPVVEQKAGFEVDGLQLKCRHDFAAKVIDYRGLYRAAGV